MNPATFISDQPSLDHTARLALAIFHFKHEWFFAIFVFCGMLVLANLVHYILFRILRRKESISHPLGWGVQRYLGKPARAIFFLTCLLIVLPLIPGMPGNIDAMLRQALIMLTVAALGWFVIGFHLRSADNHAAALRPNRRK